MSVSSSSQRFPAFFARTAAASLITFTLIACGDDAGPFPDDGGVERTPTCGLAPLIPSRTLVYGSADGGCARVERRDLSEPDMMYKSVPYEATRVAVVIDGVGLDVVDSDALTYTSTHHNWADEATARDGDVLARVTIHFVIDMGFQLEVVLLDATLDDDAREANPLAGPLVIAQQ